MTLQNLIDKLRFLEFKKGPNCEVYGVMIAGEDVILKTEKPEPPKVEIKTTKAPKAKSFTKDGEVKKSKSSTKRPASK